MTEEGYAAFMNKGDHSRCPFCEEATAEWDDFSGGENTMYCTNDKCRKMWQPLYVYSGYIQTTREE